MRRRVPRIRLSRIQYNKIFLDICLNKQLLELLVRDKQKYLVKYIVHSRLLFDKFFLQRHFYYIILDSSKFLSFNIFNKCNTILKYFNNKNIRIYRGYKWKHIKVSPLSIGFKFGQFVTTRARFIFRSKTLKKKSKANKIHTFQKIKIKKIQLLKSSKTKKQRTLTKAGLSVSY